MAGQSAGASSGRLDQGVEIRWRIGGERIALRVAPDELDRIEFGCRGRQEFDPHAGMGGEPALDELRAVRIAAIPGAGNRRPDLSRQGPEKGPDPDGIDARIGGQANAALDAVAAGRNHQGRMTETCWRDRLRWYHTGVWPHGAQGRRTSGVIMTPASLLKISAAWRRAACFFPRATAPSPSGRSPRPRAP